MASLARGSRGAVRCAAPERSLGFSPSFTEGHLVGSESGCCLAEKGFEIDPI